MSVELKDNSIKVKAALNDAIINWLHQAAEVIESQAKQNTVVGATTDTENEWGFAVDESKGEAIIGNKIENAIWEEFGTGDYALEKRRNTPWYVPVDGYVGKKRPSYNGKVVIVYGKNGKAFYKTNGKKPRRMLHNAFETKRSAIVKEAERIIKAEMGK